MKLLQPATTCSGGFPSDSELLSSPVVPFWVPAGNDGVCGLLIFDHDSFPATWGSSRVHNRLCAVIVLLEVLSLMAHTIVHVTSKEDL
jgi:hypothetical protein